MLDFNPFSELTRISFLSQVARNIHNDLANDLLEPRVVRLWDSSYSLNMHNNKPD